MSHSENPYAAPQASVSQPAGLSDDLPLASRWVRLAGAIIDGLILMVVVLVLFLVLSPVTGGLEGLADQGFLATILGTIMSIVVYTAVNYKFLLEGQTIGKRIMRTRMVDLNGNVLPVPMLVGKRVVPIYLLGALPVVGGLVGLVNALLIFGADRRCGHDLIAGTKVVQIGTDRLAGVNLPGGGGTQAAVQGQSGSGQVAAGVSAGAKWYFAQDGSQAGPVDQATLAAMVRSGEVGPDDLVWREGMAEWQPASSVAELG